MKHVLVTGGAGFIGSHLCEAMLKRGYAVTAVDNFLTGHDRNLQDARKNPNFEFFEWDVCKPIPEASIANIAKHGLHGVFHFACPASPIDFEKIPFEILMVDSIGTAYTVDLALKHGARYLVASTSEIYGDPHVHPQKEDYWGNVNTIGPRACYDEAKRFAEAYVSTAIRGVGLSKKAGGDKPLNGAIVRIFNTYGPRMHPKDGRIVPELCNQALKGEAMTIHGDGSQTRSFCFVEDEVEGIIRLFESKEHNPVNIGNPIEYTVLQFAEAVRDVVGNKNLPIRHLPGRPDDPRRRCPDITKARTVLGWEPKIDLHTGLARSIEYFRSLK